MRRFQTLTTLLFLAGCIPEPTPAPPPQETACGAAELQGLVGQSAKVLETMRFSQVMRVLRPGMAVTMDFSAERLNIEVDTSGRISRVSCG